jgi:hypothetical protein
MPISEKDRLATEVTNGIRFSEEALFGNKRKYPLQEFNAFWEAGRRYAELTSSDPLIHRKVVKAVHGLTDIVEWDGSGFRNKSRGTLSGWNVLCSVGTILISKATNLRGCGALSAAAANARCRKRRAQNKIFSAICMILGSRALVICPKLLAVKVVEIPERPTPTPDGIPW